MASKAEHYTLLEKKIFLDILKKYKDIVETKKTDSLTLREKAEVWTKITTQYNNSLNINGHRTLVQLKKLWTNLNQTQRNALTQEKQAAMATGGGPEAPPIEIDPDVAMIAPHLLEVAPANFSSNILEHEQNYQIEIDEPEDDSEALEYLDVALVQNPTVVSKKPRMTEERQQNTAGSSGGSLKRDAEKMKRIATLCDRDEEIHQCKLQHEAKMSKMKEVHLNVMNWMREEHLAQMNVLEIRKATAEAELSEIRLLKEKGTE